MRRLFALLSLVLLGGALPADAQTGTVQEAAGALDLIRAIGARSVGMGLATAASATNSEAVWVNPALIARAHREGSLSFRNQASTAEAEADIAGVVVYPVPPVGSLAVFARYLNNGLQDVAIAANLPVGSFNVSTLIIGATAATTFFDRLAVGITAKHYRTVFACTGECEQLGDGSANNPSVSALDFGTQLYLRGDSSLSIGASVINVGGKFQVLDSPQADPIPARANLGVLYEPKIPSAPDVRVRFAGDVVSRVSGGKGLGLRIGGEASYLDAYHLRAGYMQKGPGGIDSPTIGLGISRARLRIDIAQMMTSPVGAEGNRPTFLSLQYRF